MQSPIHDLPNEVLLIIFKWAFVNVRNHTTPRETSNCAPSSQFLHIVTLVCKHWKNLSRFSPILWTDLRIYVDEKPTPLSRIQTFLDLSLDLPLDLHALRRTYTDDSIDPDETLRCGVIIDMLIPHFRRCRIISFNVLHSSSLPSIHREFCGHAPHLIQLQLNSRIDDGQYKIRTPHHTSNEPFTFPSLLIMDVDGRNFADACLDLPSWKKSLSQTGDLDVSISNFTPTWTFPEYECRPLDFVEALSSIPSINTLRLENLDLDGWPDWVDTDIDISLRKIEVVDLGEDFLNHFFDVTFAWPDIALCKRSSLVGCLPLMYTEWLTLRDLSEDTDFNGILAEWVGRALSVINCPSFDDHAINSITNSSLRERGGDVSFARSVFYFSGCPNISANVVRNLMQSRVDELGEGICELYVKGVTPRPRPADVIWFTEKLKKFSWEA